MSKISSQDKSYYCQQYREGKNDTNAKRSDYSTEKIIHSDMWAGSFYVIGKTLLI